MRALRAFTVAVLSLGLIAAACGGGGDKKQTPAEAKAEITKAWETFFNPAIPHEQKKDIVENYEALKPILEEQKNNPQAQQIKAAVKDVTLSGDTNATVVYDIVSTQTNEPLLPNASGQAIYQAKHWKVTQQTFCSLIKLQDANKACPPA
jgi:ABC-type glycerol-3-phosphate transport system substrate-binding protein